MGEEIAACPFPDCKGTNCVMSDGWRDQWYVKCRDCLAFGPTRSTAELATECWNEVPR